MLISRAGFTFELNCECRNTARNQWNIFFFPTAQTILVFLSPVKSLCKQNNWTFFILVVVKNSKKYIRFRILLHLDWKMHISLNSSTLFRFIIISYQTKIILEQRVRYSFVKFVELLIGIQSDWRELSLDSIRSSKTSTLYQPCSIFEVLIENQIWLISVLRISQWNRSRNRSLSLHFLCDRFGC